MNSKADKEVVPEKEVAQKPEEVPSLIKINNMLKFQRLIKEYFNKKNK